MAVNAKNNQATITVDGKSPVTEAAIQAAFAGSKYTASIDQSK